MVIITTLQTIFSRCGSEIPCRKAPITLGPGPYLARASNYNERNGCYSSSTVLIRPTLLVTRHRHPRRQEISRTSRVPNSFEERDKKKSPAGRLNNTKKGDFWCRRDEIFVPSRVLLDFEEFPISSKASRVTWHEELVGIVQYID